MTLPQLIYGMPSENPDLYYAVGAVVSDPLIYIATGKTDLVIARDTELDVLKRDAKPRHILAYSDYFRKAKSTTPNPGDADVCLTILREKKIRRLLAHPLTPAYVVDHLRKNAIKVDLGSDPFYPSRIVKSAKEIRALTASQTMTFKTIRHVETMLRKSRIVGKRLVYQGQTLTSEFLHAEAKIFLMREGYTTPHDIIIACGDDSTEPHNRGAGPIRPRQSIIVDIFPQDPKTQFYGDATRTFCKGKPSPELHRMYLAVKEAQEMAIRMIRPGVNGMTIHHAVQKLFVALGYPTETRKGRAVGYTHGTGHGVGIALHEDPVRISLKPWVMVPGNVVTVEPGLYYPGIGGVRIEDIVVVTKTGCKVISSYPKKLII